METFDTFTTFDTIVMIIGVALIVAGVALFVTGKVVSQNNQIEAFGVKINFNNPSFMLVVAGIGMVLVPRLLPDPHRIAQLPPTAAGIPAATELDEDPARVMTIAANERDQHDEQARGNGREAQSEPPAVPAISGSYDLVAYTLNNVPQMLEGEMRLQTDGPQGFVWSTQFDQYDLYGNYYNFTYSGTLDFKAGNWWLDANASNDPTWIDAGTVNTQLISEGGFLSLSYFYHGAHVYAVWERMD